MNVLTFDDVVSDLEDLKASCEGTAADKARIDGLVEKYRKELEEDKDDIQKVIEVQDKIAEDLVKATTTEGAAPPLSHATPPVVSLRPHGT